MKKNSEQPEKEVTESTSQIFESVFLSTQMDRMGIKYLLVNSPMKVNRKHEFYKVSVLPKEFSENSDQNQPQILVQINDDLFVRLDELQKQMVAEKIFAKISVDPEKGIAKKEPEDINEFSLIIKKYGMEKIEGLYLSMSQTQEKLKEEGLL